MKKIITIVLLFFLINTNVLVNASTTTYERTESDLQIHSSIKITERVKKAALATPKVDASEKVYDFADLFSVEEESYLYYEILNYINYYSLDMAVVTINENNKSTSEEYADDFYDYNDFGLGQTFDGVLLLIDMDERMIHISTTGEAILIYDDYRIDKMLDEAYNYISKEKYFETAESFINIASDYAQKGVPSSNKYYEINTDGEYQKTSEYNFGFVVIVSIVGTVCFTLFALSKHKLIKKATHANHYLLKNSVRITEYKSNFIRSDTTKIYHPPSSSSGGFSGGGSSTHRSSSGRSHGGGSRRF